MAIKKPIVLYNGIVKQLHQNDITPGQNDAYVAFSYAKDYYMKSKSVARSYANITYIQNSIAITQVQNETSIAKSISKSYNITENLSEAMSVSQRAESISNSANNYTSEATLSANYATSLAREAVELSDISEATSIGKHACSLAREAEESYDISEATSLAQYAVSIAEGGGGGEED